MHAHAVAMQVQQLLAITRAHAALDDSSLDHCAFDLASLSSLEDLSPSLSPPSILDGLAIRAAPPRVYDVWCGVCSVSVSMVVSEAAACRVVARHSACAALLGCER